MTFETIIAIAVVTGVYLLVRSRMKSTSSGGNSTPTPTPTPTPTTTVPSQDSLLALTRVELVEKAESLGLTVPKSYTKGKIVNMIIAELSDRNTTN